MIPLRATLHGVNEISAHKFRSLLSMTGIIFGVAALVAMVGVVEGMMKGFRQTFESSGGVERMEVEHREPPVEQEAFAHLSPGRTMDDYRALRQTLPEARRVGAAKDLHWARVQHRSHRDWGRLSGITPEMIDIRRIELHPGGRPLSDWDIERKARVVIINEHLVRRLFESPQDALGKTLTIRGIVFTVIGVTRVSPSAEWNLRRSIFTPISTAIHFYAEVDDNRVSELYVQARRMEDIERLSAQIRRTLLLTHNGVEDFAVSNRLEQLEEFRKMERSFVYSLGGIAAITLLVGGIGIANVMLASISERIREIGIRKAVGARGRDIFFQFIAEALVISVLGGCLGIIASTGLVELLKGVMPEEGGQIVLSAQAMSWGFSFSVLVGLGSGVFPALKAARLPVIDALRYE